MEILRDRKAIYHYQEFSGVEHGFALRGDEDDPYQREFACSSQFSLNMLNIPPGWVKEQSLAGIVDWFDHWAFQSNTLGQFVLC